MAFFTSSLNILQHFFTTNGKMEKLHNYFLKGIDFINKKHYLELVDNAFINSFLCQIIFTLDQPHPLYCHLIYYRY